MRAEVWSIIVAGVLCATTALAEPPTEMEQFDKRVKKYSVAPGDLFDKAKGLCVCINDPGNAFNNGAAGVLDSSIVFTGDNPPARVRVRCMVMQATTGGNIQIAESCETFVPLAK